MKKFTGIFLAFTLMLALGTTSALAASGNRHGRRKATSTVCQFVDKYKDGICDLHSTNCQFVDKNKDGICDFHNTNCQFTDQNKDGICDNCPSGGTHQHNGQHSGQGKSHGKHFTGGNRAGNHHGRASHRRK